MRLLLIGLGGLVAATAFTAQPAIAQNDAWCAIYNVGFGGATNCGFYTFEQCLATVRGIGGSCYRNPMFVGGGGPPDDGGYYYHHRRRHHRRHHHEH